MPEDTVVESKSIFISKTFWTNVLALIAMLVQGLTGKQLVSLEIQVTALAVINIILRLITKQAVDWN